MIAGNTILSYVINIDITGHLLRGLSPVLLLVESVSLDDVLFLLALPAARFIISAAVLLALTSNPLAIVPAAGNTGLLPVYHR